VPVAEEHKKILLVEPAVADQITGDKVESLHLPHLAQTPRRTAISNAGRDRQAGA